MMDKEYYSWDEVINDCQLTCKELCDRCIDKNLPLYDTSGEPIIPIEYSPFFPEYVPLIIWGRIPLKESETITFDIPNTLSEEHYKHLKNYNSHEALPRITVQTFIETGDFFIIRRDCVPNLQDERLYRFLSRVVFPLKLSENFLNSLINHTSINNREFIPTEQLKYDTFFYNLDLLEIFCSSTSTLENSFDRIKRLDKGLIPCVKTTISDYRFENEYKFKYTIAEDGFETTDAVTIYFDTQGCDEGKEQCAIYSYSSDDEVDEIDHQKRIWHKYHNGSYSVQMENLPLMRISLAKKCEPILAPSIHNFSRVINHKELIINSDIELHMQAMSVASILTYICPLFNKGVITLTESIFSTHKAFNEDIEKDFSDYLKRITFKHSDLYLIGTRVMTVEEFKTSIIAAWEGLIPSEASEAERSKFLAVTEALTGKNFVDIYDRVKDLYPDEHNANSDKSQELKKKTVSKWIKEAEKIARKKAPHLLELPKWRSFVNRKGHTQAENHEKYFVDLAQKNSTTLTELKYNG